MSNLSLSTSSPSTASITEYARINAGQRVVLASSLDSTLVTRSSCVAEPLTPNTPLPAPPLCPASPMSIA